MVWSWGRLPEPKGRTFAELDELFEAKTPAREFARAIDDGDEEKVDRK